MLPTSVAFRNSAHQEVPGPAEDVEGYFALKQEEGHDLSHHPSGKWTHLSAKNTLLDDAVHAVVKPWSQGGFKWRIPNKIRRYEGTGDGVACGETIQICTLADDGTMTVSKVGEFAKRSP